MLWGPPAFVLSCAFGAVGIVLLLVGALTGATALFVAAVAAGSLSLGSALYWRSELISQWRRTEPDRRSRRPTRQR
jgi:hypothetical protein